MSMNAASERRSMGKGKAGGTFVDWRKGTQIGNADSRGSMALMTEPVVAGSK
jgi:hypothetical protein